MPAPEKIGFRANMAGTRSRARTQPHNNAPLGLDRPRAAVERRDGERAAHQALGAKDKEQLVEERKEQRVQVVAARGEAPVCVSREGARARAFGACLCGCG